MIRIHLTAEDLAETRFAFSPIWEVVQSCAGLRKPSANVFHLPWMNAHREEIARLDLGPLHALMPKGSRYQPDFISPPPEGPYPEFEEELERVLATPHDEVAKELGIAYGFADAEMPPEAARYLEEPDAALAELVASLRSYWRVAIEPHWPRMRALLEGDVLYRARMLALEGPEVLFANLHPEASWADGVLTLDKHNWDEDVKPMGRGIVLIPLVFVCPRLTVMIDEPWQPTLAYPPRGLATLWEGERPAAGTALLELVGDSRSVLLRALEIPMTTTELAARVGVTPGAISQQLAQLRRAGIVDAHRSGRGVYSSLTPLGAQLLELLRG
jgi:DNA-binding transcriptional ArsR family regulator